MEKSENLVIKGLNKIIEIMYPYTCPICGKITNKIDGKYQRICNECAMKLHYIKSPRCLVCGKPLDDEDAELCFDCHKTKHSYIQGTGVWTYTDEIKNSIYAFKYHNRRINKFFYADEIVGKCGKIIRNWDADVLIPIPLHKSKLRMRGYNQAELIAQELAVRLEIPVDDHLISRNRKTVPQKELDDIGREKNVENAFKIESNSVKYKKVILVDDIYTTGTTIDACAKILLAAGAEKIYYVSLCIGRGF